MHVYVIKLISHWRLYKRFVTLYLALYRKRFRRLREERGHAYALVSRAELQADKALCHPLKPPLLLDGHIWSGGGVALYMLARYVVPQCFLKPYYHPRPLVIF
jgi:hypothetical protein